MHHFKDHPIHPQLSNNSGSWPKKEEATILDSEFRSGSLFALLAWVAPMSTLLTFSIGK
jgi:hypothetical protein